MLNHTGGVGGETREAVCEVVRNLGYLTNFNAPNLAKNTSQTLGMIVSDIENPFFSEVVKSFEKRPQEAGYDAIQSETSYDAGLMAGAAERMLRQQVLGVSFVTCEAAPPDYPPNGCTTHAFGFPGCRPPSTVR